MDKDHSFAWRAACLGRLEPAVVCQDNQGCATECNYRNTKGLLQVTDFTITVPFREFMRFAGRFSWYWLALLQLCLYNQPFTEFAALSMLMEEPAKESGIRNKVTITRVSIDKFIHAPRMLTVKEVEPASLVDRPTYVPAGARV